MDKPAIIPFGKYKGMPVEVLGEDEAYKDWLMAQDWFRSRYAPIYNVIVNNYSVAAETPEHNLMQSKLLRGDYALAIAHAILPARWEIDYIDGVQMEDRGMDAVIDVNATRLATMENLHGTKKEVEVDVYVHVFVECKPLLGDDYPAVLRQIMASTAYTHKPENGYRHRYVLIVGAYSGVLSWDDLSNYFGTQSVDVLLDAAIEEAARSWRKEADDDAKKDDLVKPVE